MSISFDCRVHAGYVQLECTGTFTLESSMNVFQQAFEIAAREGRAAAVVDARLVTGVPPTLLERFQQGVEIAAFQAKFSPLIRLAVVGHEPIIHPQRFGEVVATSRGAVGRVFTDLDEAIAWISR